MATRVSRFWQTNLSRAFSKVFPKTNLIKKNLKTVSVEVTQHNSIPNIESFISGHLPSTLNYVYFKNNKMILKYFV